MHDEGLVKAIERIYDAATGISGVEKLASIMASEFAADSCAIPLLAHPAPGTNTPPAIIGLASATEDFDARAKAAYAEYYHDRNVWYAEGVKKGFPVVVLCHELVPPNALVRSEWYDFCQKLHWFHCLGAQYNVDESLVAIPGVLRPRNAPGFDAHDKLKMERLLPHFQRAVQLIVKLGTADRDRAFTFEALERLGLAVIITAGDGTLLYCNRSAERALSRGDGLNSVKGRLCTNNPNEDGKLKRLVYEAALTSAARGTRAGGTMTVGTNAGPLMLTISPLCAPQHGLGAARPSAIVMFASADRKFAGQEFAQSYSLTAAETKLVDALLKGETLASYAGSSGISVLTTRTHMKRVLDKTGFHRQVDLIRTIAANPLMWLGP